MARPVLPMTADLFPYLGASPEERLIVYGSLAPGGANNFILARLGGFWYRCTIFGHMRIVKGFKSFTYDPRGPEHPAWLFVSPALVAKFPDLDDFEGEDYRRILIPVTVAGQAIWAYIYEGVGG